MSIEASGFGQSEDFDVDGVSYGIGGADFIDGVNGVRAHYTRIDGDDTAGEVDLFSISYVRRFR